MQLIENIDYTVSGGLYTFRSGLIGQAVSITYQYTNTSSAESALAGMGLSLATGAPGQPVWGYLSTSYPAQALGYSGIAYVYAPAYDLGADASIVNHSFEVSTPWEAVASGDANPALVAQDLLTNMRYGANFPANRTGDFAAWATYCLAQNLVMSPALTEQRAASEWIKYLLDLTNTDVTWSQNVLKWVPLGDLACTANGATYTPNTTPVYDLTDDHFLTDSVDQDPLVIDRKPNDDTFNHIRIEYSNRANQYNTEPMEAKDAADIDRRGLRTKDMQEAHAVCDATVASMLARLLLQRELAVRNTYKFTLPWTFALLEPLDLVTVTDAYLSITRVPVRINKITETDAGDFEVEAEDCPIGMASAPAYGAQAGLGFAHDYNAAPGSVSTPVIFEAPGALTVNGLELYIAAAGLGALWGGCHVWVSLDGSNYKMVDTLSGASRYGSLTASAGTSGAIAVQLLTGALLGGSAADAAALNNLCFIRGTSNEFLSFETATLTSALHYSLAGATVRGAYGTAAAAHSSADAFVRMDGALAKSGPIDLGYIGKTIHVKLTSFNVFGAGEESLAGVTDYTYTLTGVQVTQNAAAAALLGITNAASDDILTASEKPPVILDYTDASAEYYGIDAQAAAYGIGSGSGTERGVYYLALSGLTIYLNTLTSPVAWNNLTGDTTIVGTTFRATWAAVYAARQTLLNKIASIAGTLASWTGVTGTGKPSDNATSDLNLIGRNVTIVGNGGVKSGGTSGVWDADAYSLESFTGGAFASATMVSASSNVMFGLNSDPATDSNFTSIDYAIYAAASGVLYAYESGVNVAGFGSYAAGDALAVLYDGARVTYLQNGTVLRTVAAPADIKFFFDSSFYDTGAAIRNIRFGPMSPVTGIGTGQVVDDAISYSVSYSDSTGVNICPAC